MEAVLGAAAGWLQSIGYGDWARSSSLAYPVANVIHLLGLVMLVGGIGLLDLRTLGFWKRLPLAELSRILTPFAVAGLIILVGSGSVLFAADGEALARSWTFQLKLVLILVALANVIVFHLSSRSRQAGEGEAPPLQRILALFSLVLWLSVATAGRMIAYS